MSTLDYFYEVYSFLTFRSFIEPKNSEDKHFAKHFSDLEKHSWQCGELWSENSLSLSSLSLFCCTVVTMWSVLTLKGKRKTAPEKRNPIHYTTVAILFCCSFGRRMIKKADLFSDRKCEWSMNLLINIFWGSIFGIFVESFLLIFQFSPFGVLPF